MHEGGVSYGNDLSFNRDLPGSGGVGSDGLVGMKNLLLALMLVIMGQRWDVIYNPNHNPWNLPEYRLLYVIGETVRTDAHLMMCHVTPCYENRERFTIPVPNTPTKAMSKEEAEASNGKLEGTLR